MDFAAFRDEITKYDTFRYMGKIEKIVGMTIEASGPTCNIGDVCRIFPRICRLMYMQRWSALTRRTYC